VLAYRDAVSGDADDGAGEAVVRDGEVASPAEEEDGAASSVGRPYFLDEFIIARGLDEPVGGTAESQRRIGT
jgi:hypothetical protein